MDASGIDGLTLKGNGDGWYFGSDGLKYRLQPVTRSYTGKAPVYFLQRVQDGKAEYVSGLFKTKFSGQFSFDVKDGLGVKHYFLLTITESSGSVQRQARRAKMLA